MATASSVRFTWTVGTIMEIARYLLHGITANGQPQNKSLAGAADTDTSTNFCPSTYSAVAGFENMNCFRPCTRRLNYPFFSARTREA